MNALLNNDDAGKLILRLTLGILILFHGVAKIQSAGTIEFIAGSLSSHGLPSFLVYGVFVGEVFAPVLIVLGLFTRYSAMVVVINMLFALFLVHAAEIFMVSDTGGWQLELQGFYLFTALAMIFLGSGKYAIKPD
jgi:putative oxidoreductase